MESCLQMNVRDFLQSAQPQNRGAGSGRLMKGTAGIILRAE